MAQALVFVKGAISSLERKKKIIPKVAEIIFKKNIIQAEALAKTKIQAGPLRAVDTGIMVSKVSSYTKREGNKIEGGLRGGSDYHKYVELGTGTYAGDYEDGKPGEVGRPPSQGGMKARPALNESVKETRVKIVKDLKIGLKAGSL